MTNFTLPTPEEVGYQRNPGLDAALEKIKECINSGIYQFRPENNWPSFFALEDDLKTAIVPFGWTIKSEWRGSKDDGYNVWVIKPLK